MDHAIDHLKVLFEIEYEYLLKEWKSKEYKKLSDCHSYKCVNGYRSAINELVKVCYLPEYVKSHLMAPLSKQIRDQIEIETFWAERKGK
jgi:hypothetical protein